MSFTEAYISDRQQTTGDRIGVLKYAAKSRSVFRSAAFLRLVAPSMGGPGGRAARLAGAYPVRQSRSVPPTPIGVVVRGSFNELEIASMSNDTAEASALRKTTSLPFFKANYHGQPLFAVADDIPVSDALDWASCFLESTIDCLEKLGDQHGGDAMFFTASYLAQMAKAVVNAANLALAKEERHE